jgi:hypothetical protein
VNRKSILRQVPLLLSLLFLTFTVFNVESEAWKRNHTLCFPTDDTFIHLAMAKHLVQNGVWGVTPYEFSSASSSPGYTLLIALLFKLFSISVYIPFIVNCLAAILILYYINKIFRDVHFLLSLLAMSLIIITVPLYNVVIMGMEHTTQILLSIIFIWKGAQFLLSENNRKEFVWLLLLAMAMMLIRYESIFLCISLSFLLVLQKRFRQSAMILVSAFVPVIVYGLISIIKGSHFLPNSILKKALSSTPFTTDYANAAFHNFWFEPFNNGAVSFVFIPALIIFGLRLLYKKYLKDSGQVLLLLFILTTLMHLTFAKTGWYYRYEAYLIALGLIAICYSLFHIKGESFQFILINLVVPVIAIVTLGPWKNASKRIEKVWKIADRAIINIYQQQYQMALFLKEFDSEENIAANDVGAINYLADLHCLDLEGLSDVEILDAKRNGTFDCDYARNILMKKKINIAVVYDAWYEEITPVIKTWVKIAEWKIPRNVTCGSDTVSFYAVNPEYVADLKNNLAKFESHLPPGVYVKYF